MRVPDFSSLAKCPHNNNANGGNILSKDLPSNLANSSNNYNSYVDEEQLASSIKFVQQALSTSTSCYTDDECSLVLNNDDNSNYDLMPTGNTYKSFKEFLNNNHINNNNNNNTNNKNNNNKSLNDHYFERNLEESINHSYNLDEAKLDLLARRQQTFDLDVLNLSDHNKSNVIEENDDVFSSTSSLSSISRTSKGLCIPRGIINPNYPGFQHLAHTLSEHFIVSVPSTDDSDYSENEMELSTDSFDDISGEFNESADVTDNVQPYVNQMKNSNVNSMGRHLERALTLQEYSLVNGDYFKVKHFFSLEHLDNLPFEGSNMSTDERQCFNASATPDLLETSSSQNLSLSLENHPDLLNGVRTGDENQAIKAIKLTKEYDEGKMSITPMVDIIGDFGKEVEREFGLLVNGYNSPNLNKPVLDSSKDNDTDNIQEVLIKSRSRDNNDNNNSNTNEGTSNYLTKKDIIFEPKYQKHSFDERQLPPIGVDYSRCQASHKAKAKTQSYGVSSGSVRQHKKIQQKCSILHGNEDVDELNQYKQLISEKELILSKSRYANSKSSWAQYLKDSNHTKRKESLTPNALELFDAYKTSHELDQDTLKKHLKLAKEIEKKRRNNRDEIRRRLAGLGQNGHNDATSQYPDREGTFSSDGYASSDTESHSSDSETCPKLTRKRQPKLYSSSPTPSKISACAGPIGAQDKHDEKNFENDECDFFTKQAVLQIETRMALAQSKEMAHWQLTMEKQRRSTSPITEIVHSTVQKVGYEMPTYKRRINRQILTYMSTSDLKILFNNFHQNIEKFNVELVDLLMKRDDLHLEQDELLTDIEEMTKCLGVNFSKQHTYPH